MGAYGTSVVVFAPSDTYPGIAAITLGYMPGEHEVTIAGTRVVSEFPTAALAV